MKKILFLIAISIFTTSGFAQDTTDVNNTANASEDRKDSLRISELDRYWSHLSRTVREGDLEGYAAGYHEDAVVILELKPLYL